MEIFGGFLIFEILRSQYPKIAIFEDFEESFQFQSLRKKFKEYDIKTTFHDYQLGTRTDGSGKK